MKKIISLLSLFIILSCSSSDDSPIENPSPDPVIDTFSLTVDNTNIKSYQLITLTVPDEISLSTNTYSAKFGDETISLNKIENKQLSFLTPDLSSGNYLFSISINNKEGKLNFSLTKIEDIQNIDSFLNEEILNPISEVRTISNNALIDPDLTIERKDIIEYGNGLYTVFESEFDKLTNEEKQSFGKFLLANNFSLKADENNKVKNTPTLNDWFELSQGYADLISARREITKGIVLTVAGLLIPEPTVSKLVALGGLVKTIYYIDDYYDIQQKMVDNIFIPAQNWLEELGNKAPNKKSSQSTFNFDNGIARTFKVNSTARKIKKDDSNYPDSRIANPVTEINTINSKLTELKEKITEFIAKFGADTNVNENKLTYIPNLPQERAEEVIKVAFEHFFIDDLPSDITSEITIINESSILVKLTSQNNTPSTFTATFTYDDGDFMTRSSFSANVFITDAMKITGNLNFVGISIGSNITNSITIKNESNTIPINVSDITLPEGYTSNWKSGQILAGESQEVEITFLPTEEKEYNGQMIIINDADQTNNKLEVIGSGVKDKITLESNLNFGEVAVNTTVDRILTISNLNLRTDIQVNSVELPDGYTSDFPNGGFILQPNMKKEITVTFSPTETKVYSGDIRVNNNIDNENNIISVSGKGIEGKNVYWQGRMIMTNRTGLEPCQEDRDRDGVLDYDGDCGTGGCQSCSRALFGSSFASRGDVQMHFAYSEAEENYNFKIRPLIGGTSNRYVWTCYKTDILKNQDFIVAMNWVSESSDPTTQLQNITFEITDDSNPNRIEGIWYGNVRGWDGHCLERCEGIWWVERADNITEQCERIPS